MMWLTENAGHENDGPSIARREMQDVNVISPHAVSLTVLETTTHNYTRPRETVTKS